MTSTYSALFVVFVPTYATKHISYYRDPNPNPNPYQTLWWSPMCPPLGRE